MEMKESAEACGRCSMSTVVDVTEKRNPFEGENVIEVDEDEMRTVSRHVIALGKLKDRLNDWAQSVTYGRR